MLYLTLKKNKNDKFPFPKSSQSTSQQPSVIWGSMGSHWTKITCMFFMVVMRFMAKYHPHLLMYIKWIKEGRLRTYWQSPCRMATGPGGRGHGGHGAPMQGHVIWPSPSTWRGLWRSLPSSHGGGAGSGASGLWPRCGRGCGGKPTYCGWMKFKKFKKKSMFIFLRRWMSNDIFY